jgi:tetraacyldisaccharide 4'-kinase
LRGLKTFYTQNKATGTYIFLSPVLLLLSGIYIFVLWLIKLLYGARVFKSYRSSLKIISVGNITLGGTGKTPFVMFLTEKLMSQGHRIGISLRGYKRPKKDGDVGACDYYESGDEASLLKAHTGARVEADCDRRRAVRFMEQDKIVDTVILDDGFQHWKLSRDLDIVMINATNPFGNACVLPFGSMRESLGALKRAHIFCLTHSDEVSADKIQSLEARLKSLNQKACILRATHTGACVVHLKSQEKESLDFLNNEHVCLVSGIADPVSFEKTVGSLGGHPVLKFFYADHHEFKKDELTDMIRQCQAHKITKIITTEKDAQRMISFVKQTDSGVDFYALKIVMRITKGEEALDGRLRALYTV